MKTEDIGLSGSVAIIALIYAVALAAAPETGLSAQTDPTQKPIRACPYTSGAEMSFAELVHAHHPLPNGPAETPGATGPTLGKAKLTVF